MSNKKTTISGPSRNNEPVWPRLAGLLMFVMMIYWAISSRTELDAFFDEGSLVVALGCPIALLIACFGWGGCSRSFEALFGGRATTEGVSFFRMGAGFCFACGFLGTVIAMVMILINTNNPTSVGPALAMALLTQLYGVFMAVLCFTASISIARRISGDSALEEASRSSMTISVAGTAIALSSVMIAFLSIMALVNIA